MAKQFTDEELKKRLTPEQYRVLREKGTEQPFTGKYLNHDKDGVYTCAACGAKIFKSQDKYESGMPGLEGWPSFANIAGSEAVKLSEDKSQGMHRVEVSCANCGSHLGHVFSGDKDSPTGIHFCINSAALGFDPKPTDKK